MSRNSARQTIKRLEALRNQYGEASASEKLVLLDAIADAETRSASDLRRLHRTLCFLRAFPDNRAVLERARLALGSFAARVTALGEGERRRLVDSGIAGTTLHYRFSYEVASWLSSRFPGVAAIDWDEFEDLGRFEELLEHVLHHAEADYFDSGRVGTRDWIELAAGRRAGNDFDWLMAELTERRHHARFWTSLYNVAEVPLRCTLAETGLSTTRNVRGPSRVRYRSEAMQGAVANPKAGIVSPIRRVRRLETEDGVALLDIAMASLAARHRETIHFNYANPAEVWLADVGRGVQVAATGLLPEQRYPLECTMGFLILSNGVPIGYGGSSMLYRQANTGINIFEEYRGSEAAWLWVQVMRVFHSLSGCTRFIVNPYQFGGDNREALESGAFWFYYRLGFRPVDAAVRKLARNEYGRLSRGKGYRTPVGMLKRLAVCDLHLTLPAARQSELFDEEWIELTSLLATRRLAETGHRSRRRARDSVAHALTQDLGIDSMADWSQEERRWFVRLSPIVSALNPAGWPAAERRSLASLLRAKGGDHERDFARRFGRHERLFVALKRACRRLEREH